MSPWLFGPPLSSAPIHPASSCAHVLQPDATRTRDVLCAQILSFPVGKIFYRGRMVGDFMGGTLAHEIVTEMLNARDELKMAQEVVDAGPPEVEPGQTFTEHIKDEL